MTTRAQELAFAQLADLKARGHDPVAVINQSIVRGWAGLFELKTGTTGAASVPSRHGGFDLIDYHAGVKPDGSF